MAPLYCYDVRKQILHPLCARADFEHCPKVARQKKLGWGMSPNKFLSFDHAPSWPCEWQSVHHFRNFKFWAIFPLWHFPPQAWVLGAITAFEGFKKSALRLGGTWVLPTGLFAQKNILWISEIKTGKFLKKINIYIFFFISISNGKIIIWWKIVLIDL